MKKILTNNLGLKLISILAAVILWIVVVNVDDPNITRTYNGVPVIIENVSAITDKGLTYEVLDGSDTTSVIISGKRSVVEKISKDYIRASADMKDVSGLDTVSINVELTRYSDRVNSVTLVTKNLKVKIEELAKKQIDIKVYTEGSPNEGYILGGCTPEINVLTVSGPKSVVDKVAEARAVVDVTGVSKDISAEAGIVLHEIDGDKLDDSRLEVSVTKVLVNVNVLGTKTIPISYSFSGTPADGYAATGVVGSNPDSVRVAGPIDVLSDTESIVIPAEALSINGAISDVTKEINIANYLPKKIRFADEEFSGIVTVVAYIDAIETKTVDVPTVNITIENVPEGLSAVIVDGGGFRTVTLRGLPDALSAITGSQITGVIDASNMVLRGVVTGDATQTIQGDYDGKVNFVLPNGITAIDDVYLEVILNAMEYVDPNSANQNVVPDNGAVQNAEVDVNSADTQSEVGENIEPTDATAAN